jgi:hypothetical protein
MIPRLWRLLCVDWLPTSGCPPSRFIAASAGPWTPPGPCRPTAFRAVESVHYRTAARVAHAAGQTAWAGAASPVPVGTQSGRQGPKLYKVLALFDALRAVPRVNDSWPVGYWVSGLRERR